MTPTIEITTRQGTFPARSWGEPDAPLVLLLHGFPRTSHLYRHLGPAIAETGRRAVAVDQRGYAPDVRPAEVAAYAYEHLTADVVAVADALGASTFDLVGHDWGGTVAWVTATEHPDRIRTLTVLSTPHPQAFSDEITSGGEQAERSGYMELLRSPMAETVFLSDGATNLLAMLCGPGAGAADTEVYREVLVADGAFTGALNWYRANHGSAPLEDPVLVPTLHIWGDQDHAFTRAAVDATAAHVRAPYRLVVLEGAGHYLPEECPQRVVPELVDHLATAGAPRVPAG